MYLRVDECNRLWFNSYFNNNIKFIFDYFDVTHVFDEYYTLSIRQFLRGKKEEKENFVHSFLKKESCLEVYNVPQIRVLLEGQEF